MYAIQSKLRTHLGAEELQKLAQFNPHRAKKMSRSILTGHAGNMVTNCVMSKQTGV